MSEREREIARLGLKYGKDGWKPLVREHKPGVIDPIGSIILEVDETHPPEPIPMYLTCPKCNERHIDESEFATKRHHTHSCQHCGLTWRPAVVPTVGVAFLPGFKNEPAAFMTFKLAAPEPDAQPEPDEDGLPLCSERCKQHDGKRCRLLGFRPVRFCEPMLKFRLKATR